MDNARKRCAHSAFALQTEAPAGYARQLALYRALLQKLYPQRAIRTALLGTPGIADVVDLRTIHGSPDDLFIVADPHQRIYDNRVSLASMRISVRGRTQRLSLNYRTTQEVLAWAVPLLGTDPVTGLDGEVDSLLGYRSPMHGPPPEILIPCKRLNIFPRQRALQTLTRTRSTSSNGHRSTSAVCLCADCIELLVSTPPAPIVSK